MERTSWHGSIARSADQDCVFVLAAVAANVSCSCMRPFRVEYVGCSRRVLQHQCKAGRFTISSAKVTGNIRRRNTIHMFGSTRLLLIQNSKHKALRRLQLGLAPRATILGGQFLAELRSLQKMFCTWSWMDQCGAYGRSMRSESDGYSLRRHSATQLQH